MCIYRHAYVEIDACTRTYLYSLPDDFFPRKNTNKESNTRVRHARALKCVATALVEAHGC